MKRFLTLMQREWLQHRFGWSVAALLPMSLVLLLAVFGMVQIENKLTDAATAGVPVAVVMAFFAITGSTGMVFVTLLLTSLIIVSALPRRDHGDRSVEFWLSLPAGHSVSFAAPLLVHLLLVPAAALLVGLAGGYVLSAVLVGRVFGVAEWLALPWAQLVAASLSLVLRVLAGLPLAMLWLSPLVLLVMLFTAWARRWGYVLLAVGVGLGSWLLARVFGQPLPLVVMLQWLEHAASALIGEEKGDFKFDKTQPLQALQAVPGWLLNDFGLALRDLASPLLAGGLALAAVCFALLVHWRRRGAAAAG